MWCESETANWNSIIDIEAKFTTAGVEDEIWKTFDLQTDWTTQVRMSKQVFLYYSIEGEKGGNAQHPNAMEVRFDGAKPTLGDVTNWWVV